VYSSVSLRENRQCQCGFQRFFVYFWASKVIVQFQTLLK